MHSRFRRFSLLLFLLSSCLFYTAQAQFSTFGEFNIHAGPYTDFGGDRFTIVAASGNFGVQCSIVAISIGAGPVYQRMENPSAGVAFLMPSACSSPSACSCASPSTRSCL